MKLDLHIETPANAQTIAFLTTEREQLFECAYLLFGALDPVLLRDPQEPVMVSVRGGWDAGKKIMPDAAREVLMTKSAREQDEFAGVKGFDEYWYGLGPGGYPLEIDFINANWTPQTMSCRPDARVAGTAFTMQHAMEEFFRKRRHGGITFVHNDDAFAEKAAIDIWIESPTHNVTTGAQRSRLDDQLMHEFDTLVAAARRKNKGALKKDIWVRYVEITVRHSRLTGNWTFQHMLHGLARAVIEGPAAEAPAAAPLAIA